ncbi:uncharacterized protein LOC130139418 [Syzygium oleosum]|uniref:uncharacterized protein LOC115666149 n=1 Tax=Syzygium oleosum TaxID=219896 RepID=UPI0011D19B0C|nr:uncharacterized protein LOC115666149 [Syzygium oleosum]XP_056172326.1 uncharacterized protein LOC130139418 [Syzygium oleosum]
MDGLIPMMYRAIKRKRVRSRYECLSAGDAQAFNAADFYMNGQVQAQPHLYLGPASDKAIHNRSHHRRYGSTGDYPFGLTPGGDEDDMNVLKGVAGPHSKQVVRFRRSHSVLSCFTGA